MHGDGIRRQPPADLPDGAVWQRSRTLDAAEDGAERFLDLAAFADGVLDPDDHERVAEWLAADPVAAGDVAAARALAEAVDHPAPVPQSIVVRACALVGAGAARSGNIIPFRLRHQQMRELRNVARWGGLVAAMAVVGWLGFTLGMDTSRSVVQIGRPGDDGFLQELLDPSAAFMRELNEDVQT